METRVDPDKHRKAEFHFPEGMRDFDRLPLEFQGFCGYELTVNDSMLLPGVPDIGVLEYKGRFYAFSSKEAADSFANSPDRLEHYPWRRVCVYCTCVCVCTVCVCVCECV